MTPTEMEQVFENVERRLSAIEQILPTLATKADLKRFATKEDLERFATKEDLKRFLTKEDSRRFATKEDLKPFATKEELQSAVTRLEVLIEHVDDKVRVVAEGVISVGDDVRMVAESVARASTEYMDALMVLTARLEQKGVI